MQWQISGAKDGQITPGGINIFILPAPGVEVDLKILDFECSRTKVAVGDTVKLEWAVAGEAVKCVWQVTKLSLAM